MLLFKISLGSCNVGPELRNGVLAPANVLSEENKKETSAVASLLHSGAAERSRTWTQRRCLKSSPRPQASSVLRACHPLLSAQLPSHVRGRGPSSASPEHFLWADRLTVWRGNASSATTRGQRSSWGEQQVGLRWGTGRQSQHVLHSPSSAQTTVPRSCLFSAVSLGDTCVIESWAILGSMCTGGSHISPNF